MIKKTIFGVASPIRQLKQKYWLDWKVTVTCPPNNLMATSWWAGLTHRHTKFRMRHLKLKYLRQLLGRFSRYIIAFQTHSNVSAHLLVVYHMTSSKYSNVLHTSQKCSFCKCWPMLHVRLHCMHLARAHTIAWSLFTMVFWIPPQISTEKRCLNIYKSCVS